MKVKELKYNQLRNECCDECKNFESTADLEPLEGIIGQERAVEAIDFGLNIKRKGYNIYISGISGTGRNSYIKLKRRLMKKTLQETGYTFIISRNPKNPYL